MSLAAFYQHKAEQCDHMAATATDPAVRTKFTEEAALWRGIAKDISKQDRDERGPP